jgi:hypothetical protein
MTKTSAQLNREIAESLGRAAEAKLAAIARTRRPTPEETAEALAAYVGAAKSTKPRKPRKPKVAPETERQRLERVVEERAAAARYSFKHGLRDNETDRSNLIAARFDLARRIALDLGHHPLKQGISYECSHCGASGTFDIEPVGAIFTDRCGA